MIQVPSNGKQYKMHQRKKRQIFLFEEYLAVMFYDDNGNEGWRADQKIFCLEDLGDIADQVNWPICLPGNLMVTS